MIRLSRSVEASMITLLLAGSCALPDGFRAVEAVDDASSGNAGKAANDPIGATASTSAAGNAGHGGARGGQAGSTGQSAIDGTAGTAKGPNGGSSAGSNNGGTTFTGGASNAAGSPFGGKSSGGPSAGGNGTDGDSKAGQSGSTADGMGGTGAGGNGAAGNSSGAMNVAGAAGGLDTGGLGTGGLGTGGLGTGGLGTGGLGTGGLGTGGLGTGGARPALLDNCSLLLHMDEPLWNGSPLEAIDASGAGNNGTAVNGATTSSNGKYGRGGYFDGVGYLSVADSASLRPDSAFTVSAWIFPTALDGDRSPGIVVKRWGYGDRSAFSLFLWSEYRLFVDIDGEDDRFSSTFQFANDSWYHVALVFDGTLASDERARIYINGNLDSVHTETSAAVSQYDSSLEIGRLRNGGDVFVGALDEVAMWRRALTLDEIRTVYLASGPL